MSGPPVALVVGASRGIGATIARRLGADGYQVVAVGRNESDLMALTGTLDGSEPVVADVSTPDGIESLVAAAIGHRPSVVVAVARVREPWQRVSRLDPKALARSVDLHTGYLLALCSALLPLQRDNRTGRWIFLSSVAAAQGGPGQAAYVSHKSAIEGLSRTLAVEEGPHGITANVVAPGFIPVAGLEQHYEPALFDALGAMNALGRPGTADEVAHAVSFLADPRAAYITGVTLPVDGGARLGWTIARAVANPVAAADFAASRRGEP